MKMTHNILTKTLFACSLAACVQLAFCQFPQTVNSRRAGRGILHAYGRNFHPNEVTVNLAGGGRATISTNRTTFFGSWRPNGNQAELTIDGIHGTSDETDRATGGGHVTLDRDGDWTHVLISAQNLSDHTHVSLDFTPSSDRRPARRNTRRTWTDRVTGRG